MGWLQCTRGYKMGSLIIAIRVSPLHNDDDVSLLPLTPLYNLVYSMYRYVEEWRMDSGLWVYTYIGSIASGPERLIFLLPSPLSHWITITTRETDTPDGI